VDLGKYMPLGVWIPLAKSNVITGTLEPVWDPMRLRVRGTERCLIEVIDWEKSGVHQLIGRVETSFQELHDFASKGRDIPLFDPHQQSHCAGYIKVRSISPIVEKANAVGLITINLVKPPPLTPLPVLPGNWTIFKLPEAREKEPMLLLDTTGSMNEPTSARDATPRHETVAKIIGALVERMQVEDSQASKEAGGGGLMTVTFAGGRAEDLDDLNPQNLAQKWNGIKWSGGTQIMPGWKKLMHIYDKEFGRRRKEDRPYLIALVITDGEAEDLGDFERTLAHDHNSYVVIAIVGYGPHHARCMDSFNRVQQKNPRVCVLPLDGDTPPDMIAGAMLSFIQ